MPQIEYLAQAQKLADAGYTVVSYTVRGFWHSGGDIEVAGPPDIADASSVIDWALAHTPSDPRADRHGRASRTAPASACSRPRHDKRIKAVVAMSGWADLIGSIYIRPHPAPPGAPPLLGAVQPGHRPPERRDLPGLQGLPRLRPVQGAGHDRLGQEALRRDLCGPDQQERRRPHAGQRLGRQRSSRPTSTPTSSSKLTGPKRLEFRPGDHATAELTGTARAAQRRLDGRPPLVRPLPQGRRQRHRPRAAGPAQVPFRRRGYEGYPDWKSVARGQGEDGPRRHARRSDANVDSGADGGIVFLSSILDQVAQVPPMASIPLLSAVVRPPYGSPEAYATAQQIRGNGQVAHHAHADQGERHPRRIPLRRGAARPRQAGQQRRRTPSTGRTPGKPFRRRPGAVLHGVRRSGRRIIWPWWSTRRGPALHRAQPARRAADLLLARVGPVISDGAAPREVITGCCRAGHCP